jgi:hypothetical protein
MRLASKTAPAPNSIENRPPHFAFNEDPFEKEDYQVQMRVVASQGRLCHSNGDVMQRLRSSKAFNVYDKDPQERETSQCIEAGDALTTFGDDLLGWTRRFVFVGGPGRRLLHSDGTW